jgi:hypothetical protein
MLNFCIFLKTKLKIYLSKLLKSAIISDAYRFLAQRKQNVADLSLRVGMILYRKRAIFVRLELK